MLNLNIMTRANVYNICIISDTMLYTSTNKNILLSKFKKQVDSPVNVNRIYNL